MKPSRPPIIIGGCARSGTTLLLSVLSCHPHIYAIPDETWLLCPDANHQIPDPPRLELDALEALVAAAEAPRTAQRWAEKSPKNCLYFPAIRQALPDAVLLGVVRDGRDVVTSRHPTHPDRYWVDSARWVREATATLDADILVRYESLVTNYDHTVGLLLPLLGEDAAAMGAYPAAATVTESGAWGGPARPITAATVGRWNDPVHAARVEALYAFPGALPLLAHLGYGDVP